MPPFKTSTNSFECSIQIAGFDKVSDEILHRGGQIVMPKFATSNRCWQGYFIDPDNNTFGIFEVDENAA